jgi:hypothetical protein
VTDLIRFFTSNPLLRVLAFIFCKSVQLLRMSSETAVDNVCWQNQLSAATDLSHTGLSHTLKARILIIASSCGGGENCRDDLDVAEARDCEPRGSD